MFCDRCEGELFVLIFDTHVGSIESSGLSKTWKIWNCLECGLYKRKVKETILKGKDETNK